MNFDTKRHVRQQKLYCPVCRQETEQGVWIQKGSSELVFGKPYVKPDKEFADCLQCDNTDSISHKESLKPLAKS